MAREGWYHTRAPHFFAWSCFFYAYLIAKKNLQFPEITSSFSFSTCKVSQCHTFSLASKLFLPNCQVVNTTSPKMAGFGPFSYKTFQGNVEHNVAWTSPGLTLGPILQIKCDCGEGLTRLGTDGKVAVIQNSPWEKLTMGKIDLSNWGEYCAHPPKKKTSKLL